MPKVAIVTDSTAYIPDNILKQNNIATVPLVVIWGEETLRDGIDIQPVDFYTRLKTAKVMPTTSQASVGDMTQTFTRLLEEGYDVMGVFLSSKLSGTLQSAIQGREDLASGKDKVVFVDSETTAMALGFQALSAARAAAGGASLAECQNIVESARSRTGIYFVVDTLEFLHRGGRIGGGKRFIGTALNIKPILTIGDGKVEAAGSVRTKKKALDHIIDIVASQCKGKSGIRLATLHANAENEAKELLQRASEQINPVESILSEVSPVIGTHTGPGTLGLAYITD